jgi:hypothetical protein
MKTKNRFLIPVICLLILSSCTVYRNIPIEILRTREVKLPSSVGRIAFVYRNFKYNNDTLQNYFLKNELLVKDLGNQGKNVDSIIVTTCLHSAANALVQNGICHDPVIYPLDIFPRQTGEGIHPLPSDLIKKLALPAQAEIIILLETFSYFFSQNGTQMGTEFQEAKMAGIWTMYSAASGAVTDRKTMTDTVYWNKYDENGNVKKETLPPRLPALQQAGEVFGENYARRFYPDWTKVDRLMIIPPLEDFRLAAEYTDKKEWDKADSIWSKYTDRRFGRLAISALYNLSLAKEINDNLNEALNQISKASDLAKSYPNSNEHKLTESYREILIQRIRDIEKAKKLTEQ